MLLLSFAVLTALKAVSLSKLNSEDLDGISQILTEDAKMQGTAKRESVFTRGFVDTLFQKIFPDNISLILYTWLVFANIGVLLEG